MTRLTLTLIIPALVALLVSSPASAQQVKTMECENYVIGSNGRKDKISIFNIRHNVGSDNIAVKLKSNNNSMHPPERNDWHVIWKTDDNMRMVAMETHKPDENSFDSPVIVLDIDYQKPWYRQVNLGGYLENNVKLVSSPWKRECRRLD